MSDKYSYPHLMGTTKLPEMKELPPIDKYRNESYLHNPLLRFNYQALKRQRVRSHLKAMAADSKCKTAKESVEEMAFELLGKDLEIEYPPIHYLKILREQVESAEFPPILDSTLRSIREKIAQQLLEKYTGLYKELMDEVTKEHDVKVRAVRLRRTLKPLPGEEWEEYYEKPFKFGGKTELYDTYLKNRNKLKEKLMITHPVVRQILSTSKTKLPKLLNDYNKYRDMEWFDFDRLFTLMKNDLKIGQNIVANNWYTSIVKLITAKKKRRKPLVPDRLLSNFIRCASGLIEREITELMKATINHLLDLTKDEFKMPRMKIDLLFEDGQFITYPSLDDIQRAYRGVVNDIAGTAQNLISLETWFLVTGTHREWITVRLCPDFLGAALHHLENNLALIYSPVLDYIKTIENTFEGLISESLAKEIQEYIQRNPSFEECQEKITLFQDYSVKTTQLAVYEYFYLARLCQTDIIRNFRALADSYKNDILKYMIFLHHKENRKINAVFKELERRALTPPKSTEELVEMNKMILYATITLVPEMKVRLSKQLHYLSELHCLTTLSGEHTELSNTVVHWIENIKPIFQKNSALYEHYKGEFEKRLVVRNDTLNKKLEEFLPQLEFLNLMDDYSKVPQHYQDHISHLLRTIQSFEDEVAWINKEEGLFKFPLSTYPELDEIKAIVTPFAELMLKLYKWQKRLKVWMDGVFDDLDVRVVEDTTEEYFREITKMSKVYRARIRQQATENYPRRFKGNVDDSDIDNQPVPLKLCAKALESIKEFRHHIPLVGALCNPALTEHHWEQMSAICGFDITPDAGASLRKMLALNLSPYIEQFEVVSIGANKEKQIKENMAKMLEEWAEIKFTVSTYKETGLPILSALDEVQAILDDHIVKTLTMRGSAFVKPFETEVREWYDKLTRINKTIDEWGKVQSQWLYLLPIFSSKDIVSQMPTEGSLFQEVDGTYRRIMAAVNKEPKVLPTAGAVGILELLLECTEKLETINDGVNAYLEKKRLFFPRFFFLSNDEMLEILSETKDPTRVQPHLKKCFEGIARLGLTEERVIQKMFSAEGEEVNFTKEISTDEAKGGVERWLVWVEEEMKVSVRQVILDSHLAYPTVKRTDWIISWPGQVVLCVAMIHWTADMHNILVNGDTHISFSKHLQKLQRELNDTVALVRGKLTKQARITLGALVVLDVHAKDVTEELYRNKVAHISDFQWLAQLRYYWDNDVLVRITNATVKYAYEYLGNTPRLVITPLTDRCYRTLIGAYHLHLNGAPEGPAGTGKTETTKDLAKALAVQCVVFNCSDGLDYIAMGKFFKGLASSGAWACFDEFNRIELEVLSVVAQQILSIVQAVRAKLTKFLFEGTEIVLNPACYVCITMNPGYAGRSELPDNLKVLFRTVAMMVPDYALIGEISLYSYGFVDARNLSVKIVTTYRLCSEQLSSQNHYDYGMRAVKTVLAAAGNLKLKYPDEKEDILLLRSLIDVNLPKFLSHDIPLFEGIISDLFPGVVLPPIRYDTFLASMAKVCEEMNLQVVESFKVNVIQTYEMMIVRHGFMLVGGPFGGKTSALKVLAATLTQLNELGEDEEKVRFRIINPKSVTMGQLYGQFDPVSHEWTDGVVATTFRKYATADTPDRKWVIFDGPVDAVWIENMNTVLDDNKKLCLNSGEIIALTPQMSMIFEVMDLAQASPATVSRCGMIYFEPASLGWKPLVKSWINKQDKLWIEDYEKILEDMFDWLVPPCLHFVKKQGTPLAYAGDTNLVRSFMLLIQMLITDAVKENEDVVSFYIKCWIQAAFLFAGVWTLGGALDSASRDAFDQFYRDIWKGNNEEYPIPESMEKVEISVPGEGILHDYYYVFKLKGNWRYWPEVLKSVKYEEMINIQQTMIPTVDTLKLQYILDLHIRHFMPLLFVGDTGTGKSFYTQNMLMYKLSLEEYVPALITFTVQTSANQTQDLILSKLNKRRKGLYGPPHNKKCIVFVDDLNMPAKEIYGAQPAIELLRQYFDHGHWYDLKDTSKIFLFDIMFLAAMGLPGGSRQDIYSRFLCHFNIYSLNSFSDESMVRIFSNVLLMAWKRNGFATDVMTNVMSIVQASLDVYHSAIMELRPTPAKSHYVFNLRDFSRLILGCALLKKDSVDSKKVFIKLWVHEVLRVFYDRLVENEDRNWLYEKLRGCVRDHFKDHFDSSLDTLPQVDGKVTEEALQDLMFGTFLDVDSLDEDKKYEEIPSLEVFYDLATSMLNDYNATTKAKMDIVLFRYALEHLSRISRILSMPGGCGLLVGVGGSGRQSLTKLATAMASYRFFQPEITKGYGPHEWREDLKKVLKMSGGQAKDTTFLFTDGQIKDELFLQDIDSLLNSGEVPNLFPIDEQQEILEMVRLAAQGGNRNLDISVLAVLAFFVNRCKQKLHILLCFSPIGSSFRNRLRLYPSFVNCCTIDWFQPYKTMTLNGRVFRLEVWPEDALEKVAHRYMPTINVSDDVKKAAVVACKYFHVTSRELSDEFFSATGRNTYITSAAYLELIRSFTNLTKAKQDEMMTAKQRYVGGLDQLFFASEQVAAMQKELSDLQPQLVTAAKDTVRMMERIELDTAEVEKASVLVRADEKVANEQAAAAQALKTECEADLALAIPVLEDAIAALNTLKPTDITLVKSMKSPPDAIKLVMAAVCVMKDVKPARITDPTTGRKINDYWGPSKRILGDMYFLQSLKEYDKDNIHPAIMHKIRTEFLPHKDFKPHIVAKASSAAEGLCKWVIAMDMYDAVAKEVAPKKAKLEIAEREYNETMDLLNEKRSQLAQLESKLAELQKRLDETVERKRILQQEVELCENKLQRAEKLIGGLGGEKARWSSAADALQESYDSLAGDILISCGVLSYLGPFTMAYRTRCIQDWWEYVKILNIPCSEQYNFTNVLGSDIKIQNWNIAGLPRDVFSIDNAIIVDMSSRWSLIVDPQGQANEWIKNMEKYNDLQVTKFTDPNYMKIIEESVEIARPVLLENVEEELEPPLDPLINKQIFQQGSVFYISLGDNVVVYNQNFRFYMTSKLRNPHLKPEIFNKVTVVNFSLTKEGLEDQLLGIVVAKERPDLEETRQELIVSSAKNVQMLKEVEDKILHTLSHSEGNILEDESAIEVLDSSKLLSEDIKLKQEEAKETHARIESFRLSYHPIASHSSVLYYCITELPNVDPMYQYSLEWFINLYVMSIETSNKSKIIERRLKFLYDTFTYNLYGAVCRSLFEKDKLLFSFIMCTNIMMSVNEISRDEFIFFLTGGVGVDKTLPPNPATSWLSEKCWEEICRLKSLAKFEGFSNSFAKDILKWKEFYDHSEPLSTKMPEPWETSLSKFQKLIILRILRLDKLINSVTEFIQWKMGDKFVTPPPFDIGLSYEDSNCLNPLVFILSPGADPMAALLKFAEKMGFSNERFFTVSLGQGQGPIAETLLARAKEEGSWICLQNCHLAVSWMPRLEALWESWDVSNTNIHFRLWLTSYPSDKFPASILQNAVKMTNEPPTGLKQNLLRSYQSEPVNDPEFYKGCPGKEKVFTRLLYGICFFHAVVQERRKFGALGWNIPYGFNESDFQISILQLQMFVNEHSEVPYDAVLYLTGECNYGGRVTDDWDRRALNTILQGFVNKDVVDDPKYMFSSAGNMYGLPRKTEHQVFIQHIELLPADPPPDVFGLHTNAGITRDIQNSRNLLNSMLLVQREGVSDAASGEKGGSDHLLGAITNDILNKLPKNFDIEEATVKYPTMYAESMNTVLVQEMERFNKLSSVIRSSLTTLGRAIEGLVVMSPQLEDIAASLLVNKVPTSWAQVSYPSLKPLGSYITDLIVRISVLQKWYEEGKPDTFWLSGFFFTQAFLTGALQNYARKYTIPIDKLVYDFEVLASDIAPFVPSDGVLIYGLFVDGARWDRQLGRLEEQLPKVLFDAMPLIWLKPCKKQDLSEGGRYKCPLYKTSERKGVLSTTGHSTNYVLALLLDTNLNPVHWIKRGVALLCQLDD